MRARKPKNIGERLVRYAQAIQSAPCDRRGRWLRELGDGCTSLHVDLGCGKGAYSIESARRDPHALYVGIDCEDVCIALAAQRAVEAGLGNVAFVLADADGLADMFGPGEIDVLHLNFSTPFPKRRHASGRLCHMDRLLGYRELLSPGGRIWMKTDSQPLFDFALTQFDIAGYEVEWQCRDMHGQQVEDVRTEYEERLSLLGASIHGLVARVGELKGEPVQTAPLSLQHYLPDDLDAMGYVPYGMEALVDNLRNRRRKEEDRAARLRIQGRG